MNDRLMIIGNFEKFHTGTHLLNAARELGLYTEAINVQRAYAGPGWLTAVNWRLRGHLPNNLNNFSADIIRACKEFRPDMVLSVGIAPVDMRALSEMRKNGIRLLNYLTDDPWNPDHRASWFMRALPVYDHIYSTRQANIEELRRCGCRRVSYLPFAYAPELHFPEPPAPAEKPVFDFDIVFIGGADKDRIPYIAALIKNGLKLGLYGGYWERFGPARPYARGHADPQTMRKAIGASKIALCLVRKANRDGSSMRTFEIPAIGGCMLTEDTEEHRKIFAKEGENVRYFKGINEITGQAARLLGDEKERARLSGNASAVILKGRHTYKDRLKVMIGA